MPTKNIQDVVAEKVEEMIDVFKDRFHMTSSTKADEEAEKRLFDPIRAKLTTPLTQLVKEVEAGEREKFRELHSKWDGRADIELLTEIEKLSK